MNSKTSVCRIICAGVILGLAAGLHADDIQKDQDSLQGSWEVIDLHMNGKPAPAKLIKALKFSFDGDNMMLIGPPGIGKRKYRFKLYPDKKPKAIDLMAVEGPAKGLMVPAIYELKNQQLKLCIPNGPTRIRPLSFKSYAGSDRGVFTLRRVRRKNKKEM